MNKKDKGHTTAAEWSSKAERNNGWLLLLWREFGCLVFFGFFLENSTWELVWLVRDKSESHSFLKKCVWKEMSRLHKNTHSFVHKFSKRLLLNHHREDRRKFYIFAVGFWYYRSRNFFKCMDNFNFPKFCRFRKTTGKNSDDSKFKVTTGSAIPQLKSF